MPNNRPTVSKFDDWMRDQERRTGSLERRTIRRPVRTFDSLLQRITTDNAGSFGVDWANGSSDNLIWFRTYAIPSEVPTTARKAFVKWGLNARSPGGIQSSVNYLKYRFGGVGDWVILDRATEHNDGQTAASLGSTLMGWIEIPEGTSEVNLKGTIDVGGGGFSLHTYMSNVLANFFN